MVDACGVDPVVPPPNAAGVFALIVIAIVLILIAIAVAIFFIIRKVKKDKKKKEEKEKANAARTLSRARSSRDVPKAPLSPFLSLFLSSLNSNLICEF